MAGCNVQANDRQVGGGHYKTKVEHWDYIIANDIPYLEAQIIKYLTRWRQKGGHEDIRKAQHFLEKLMETEGVDQGNADGAISGNSGRLQQGNTKQDTGLGNKVSAGAPSNKDLYHNTPAGRYDI